MIDSSESIIVRRIRRMILRLNKNCMILMVGPTGSGKTYSAIKLAKKINPKFDVNIHLVFSARQFSNLLKSGILRKGSVIVFDEAGIGFDSREWAQKVNRKAMHVLESFRDLNLCVIFTVPTIAFVDKAVRRLYHYLFECERIDYEKNVCIIKPLEVQLNPRFDKMYYKYPRRRTSTSGIVKITHLDVGLLDKETKDKYEARSKVYKEKVRIDFDRTVAGAEIQETLSEPRDINVLTEEVKKDIGKVTRVYRGENIIDWRLIKMKFNCSESMARQIRTMLIAEQTSERDI